MPKKLGKPPPPAAAAQEEGREELFASCSFADLGLHPTLCAHLQGRALSFLHSPFFSLSRLSVSIVIWEFGCESCS